MTREEIERNKRWTEAALARTNGQGQPIPSAGVTQKSITALPKDENGQVIIPDNIDTAVTKAYTGKPVFKQVPVKSIFADQPVVNAMTDF